MAYTTSKNVRSDLTDQIERYWVGREASNIGMQYLALKDGRLELNSHLFERTDVLCLQDFKDCGGCNIFIEANGAIQIDVWDRSQWSLAAQERAYRAAAEAIAGHHCYMARQARFLATKPWLRVVGMTPEEGVARLRELGW